MARAIFVGMLSFLFLSSVVGQDPPARATLINGDVNCSGVVDLSDSVFILNWLFLGTNNGPCPLADPPALVARLAAAEARIAALETELAATDATLRECQTTLTATEEELNTTYTELANCRLTFQECAADRDFLRDELRRRDQQLAETDAALAVCEEALAQKKPALADCVKQLGATRGALDVCEMERENISVNLQAVEDGLARCESELTECLSKLPPAAEYRVLGLGFLPGEPRSMAYAITDGGLIVGVSGANNARSFLWEEGHLADLGLLIDETARVVDINDRRQIIGTRGSGESSRGFLWDAGDLTELGSLPGGTGTSAPTAINERTQIVGFSSTGTRSSPFLWQDGRMIQIGELPSGDGAGSAWGINNLGQVVGSVTLRSGGTTVRHAFFWQNGVTTDLGVLPGGNTSEAYGINDSGQIVGCSHTGRPESRQRAVLWRSSAAPIQDLGDLPGRDTYHSCAWAINDFGKAVGSVNVGGGDFAVFRALEWTEDAGMRDLNDLIDASSGWTLFHAVDINNRGEIVGYGTNSDGFPEAFLLIPNEAAGE